MVRPADESPATVGRKSRNGRYYTPRDRRYFDSRCAGRRPGNRHTERVRTLGTEITAREAEVLALVGEHLTNAEIAEARVISVRTVESHVAALLRKLNVPDRRSLARSATVDQGPPRGTLPAPATPFLGRAAERAELTQAL